MSQINRMLFMRHPLLRRPAILTIGIFIILLFVRTMPIVTATDLSSDYSDQQPATTPDLSEDYSDTNYYASQADREIKEYLAGEGLVVDSSEGASSEYTKQEIEKLERKLQVIDNITGIFGDANGLLVFVSVIFAGINLIMQLSRELSQDVARPSIDVWMRLFLTMAVTFLVIYNLDWIFEAIEKLGELIQETVTTGISTIVGKIVTGEFSATSAGVSTAEEYLEFDNHMSMIRILTMFLNCAIDSVVYAVGIRMTVRRIFAPVAVADMCVSGGTKSAGYRYLLRFLAYYIQIGIIYAATVAFVVVYAVALNAGTGVTWLWTTVAAKGALATVIAGSGELSYEILNADA